MYYYSNFRQSTKIIVNVDILGNLIDFYIIS